jgi:leucyl-tRNA synthetase
MTEIKSYSPAEIEPKWQAKWQADLAHQAENDSAKPKFYCLDMFPYPSGAGLHVGHIEGYTATDIFSRFKRSQGFNVLHPMGWDAFGLPAENYAIKTGIHPSSTTQTAIKTFTEQIDAMGFSYDWSHELDTSSPEYYKWTQWLFLEFYKHGLAYKKMGKVNWCDSCQTVLANEQVVGGNCERCGNPVRQKDLEQWYFKVTDFLEDKEINGQKISGLISGLDKIDWPDSTKAAQKNWIGKSEGALVNFKITDQETVQVFTTRPDTLFGCTYLVVCPEHKLIQNTDLPITNRDEIENYVLQAKGKTELERTIESKEKTGVRIEGLEAINPVDGSAVPIYVADYVLAGYGTGAIMAVPGHDERDWEFAKKFNLPIIEVISGGNVHEAAYTGPGTNINSGFLDGLKTEIAKPKMIDWLEKEGYGQRNINYKLRDWLISRQRYWGAPIPIIYCDHCGAVPVPTQDLPVLLPTDVDFKPTGESPLVNSKAFHDVKCPICGLPARRESDTMDTFVCSSWYFLRFADNRNSEAFADLDKLKYWLPVDTYVGGAEHTVLHLLYARFFAKALMSFGYVDFDEPFLQLRHPGTILGEDSNKMSKSKGNVVNPNEAIAEFGADALRVYEMFMGPFDAMKPWSTKSIVGSRRFLDKIWRLQAKAAESAEENPKLTASLHQTIKKVTEDIENFRFNTAISQMMILLNELEKVGSISLAHYDILITLLAPFAPHIAEEIWQNLGHQESVFKAAWPKYDTKIANFRESLTIVVQINGKVREQIEVAPETGKDELEKQVLALDKIAKLLEGAEIKKIIHVPNKLVNIVI